jgi:hypothetical protein
MARHNDVVEFDNFNLLLLLLLLLRPGLTSLEAVIKFLKVWLL